MASATFDNLLKLMDGRELSPVAYHDHGSLVSLSRFSTVGSLMGTPWSADAWRFTARSRGWSINPFIACILLAIHGWLRGSVLILIGRVNAIVRPKLKFH
jgi:NADH dehydrogenase